MQWQALELGKKVPGAEHPDTLASMNNLAVVLTARANTTKLSRYTSNQ